MRGLSPAVAAWPRGGEARKLGQCGGRTHEHCQLMGMDLVWPTRLLRDVACAYDTFLRRWPLLAGSGL